MIRSSPDKRLLWWICLVLAVATVGVYWGVLGHDFVNYDDPAYVTDNPAVQAGLSLQGMKWAFTHGVSGNWHPLTMISHMADCSLYGLKAGRHHLTNLLLHTANVVLLFVVLRGLTGALWRSAFVAALFGLHPLHVESVAWVSERKDVLSGLFFVLTLWAYGRYAARLAANGPQTTDHGPQSRAKTQSAGVGDAASAFKIQNSKFKNFPTSDYTLALVFFVFGLMSKPMLVTVPFVLLLLDYWPLGRLRAVSAGTGRLSWGVCWRELAPLVLEKIPFFLLSAVSSAVTLLAQKQEGAVIALDLVPVEARIENAVVACLAYLGRLVWPDELAVFYLRPRAGWPGWLVILGFLVVVVITLVSALQVLRRKRPYLPVGWFWFLGMLVPVLGIVQVGSQAFANRYTYLPLIGCFIILAWGGAELVGERPLARKWISGVALMVVIAFGFRSYREVAYWKDSVTLFKRCIAVTEDNFMARNNLAVALIAQGRYGEAKEQCLAALRINPRSATVLQNLGVVVAMLGDFTGAKSYLDEAARLEPGTLSTYSRLGLVFTLQGKTQQALDFYRDSLERQPDDERTCNNLAWLLATNPDPQFRNGAEAVKWAENACVLTHYQTTVYLGTLAAAYAEAGRFQEAITTARKAVALARTNGQKDLEQANQRLLELYQAGHPYREEKAANGGVRPSY